MAADLSDHNLSRLLARRAKEPTPDFFADNSQVGTPDTLDLSFTTGLEEDEETKQKIAYLKYEAETVGDKNSELEAENQRLRLLLRTRENDIFKLKNEFDELKRATAGGGMGSEKAIQRIVELSKKNRDLQCKLGSETAAKNKLVERLNNVNNQEVQRKLKSAVRAKKEDSQGSPPKDNERVLKERMTVLSNKLTEVSHQVETSKQENKLLMKLLQREVGEGATVQSILANPNTWRGRAEQVAVLQNKLSNLKPEDTPPTRMEMKRQRDIRNMETNRKKQLQDCKKEIDQLKEEALQSKKNYDAVKARNSTLSSEIKTLRAQVAALTEKGRNDDGLISQLLEEKEQAGDNWGLNDDAEDKVAQIREMSEKMEMLHLNVGQKERRIKQLEEEITRAREINMNIRPVSVQQPRSAPEAGNLGKAQEAGFDTTYLLRATEVEKDRLFELTDVLNQRISRLEDDKIAHESQNRKLSRQLVDLEKLVENLKSKKVPRCDACNSPATLLHPSPHSQFSVLEDEVTVLKSHVEAVNTERQQDLSKYKQLLDQSRQVFIAGLKEMQKQMQ